MPELANFNLSAERHGAVNTDPSSEKTETPRAGTEIGAKHNHEQEAWWCTGILGLAWVVIFGAMVWHQGSWHANPNELLAGGINTTTAYLFGSVSTEDLYRGQWWRALTATFVHFSWLHLLVNLIVLYQLGRLVEPWYGAGPFLALYVVIGIFANICAMLVRPWIGLSTQIPSGGGSGFLCGLIALIAVVGWRSRDRRGSDMLMVMALQLLFLGVMGLTSQYVKNLVHAAGAIGGVAVGFLDRLLIWSGRGLVARGIGIAFAAFVAVSFIALLAGNGADQRLRASQIQATVRYQIEARLLVNAEVMYLKLANAPGESLGDTGEPRGQSQLARRIAWGALVSEIDRVDKQTGIMSPQPLKTEWISLARELSLRRPHPGEITRFRTLNQRFLGRAELAAEAGGRSVGFWNGKLPPPKIVTAPAA